MRTAGAEESYSNRKDNQKSNVEIEIPKVELLKRQIIVQSLTQKSKLSSKLTQGDIFDSFFTKKVAWMLGQNAWAYR
jgi:hypothetical protein